MPSWGAWSLSFKGKLKASAGIEDSTVLFNPGSEPLRLSASRLDLISANLTSVDAIVRKEDLLRVLRPQKDGRRTVAAALPLNSIAEMTDIPVAHAVDGVRGS